MRPERRLQPESQARVCRSKQGLPWEGERENRTGGPCGSKLTRDDRGGTEGEGEREDEQARRVRRVRRERRAEDRPWLVGGRRRGSCSLGVRRATADGEDAKGELIDGDEGGGGGGGGGDGVAVCRCLSLSLCLSGGRQATVQRRQRGRRLSPVTRSRS